MYIFVYLSYFFLAKRRLAECNFLGADILQTQLRCGTEVRRVGLRMIQGPPARHNIEIYLNEQHNIGYVTSGCPSPSLGGNVAMGYIAETYKQIGAQVYLKIRNQFYKAEVTKLPFIKTNYYYKPKTVK